MAGNRAASTEVTTRWRGGSGGTWGARNSWPRWRCNAERGSAQGSRPSSVNRPWAGGSAQAMTCSSVVLPAPDGPMTATCSPEAICRSSERSAGAWPVRAAGWRAETPCSVMFNR